MSPVKRKARPKPSQTYLAPALAKGMDIVELLADVPGGLSISEIADRLDRSMSEVFRIVVVMEAHGWLRKDPATDCNSVTYHVLDVAIRATPAQALTVPYLLFIDDSAPTSLERTRDLLRDCAREVSRGLGGFQPKPAR